MVCCGLTLLRLRIICVLLILLRCGLLICTFLVFVDCVLLFWLVVVCVFVLVICLGDAGLCACRLFACLLLSVVLVWV